MSQDHDRADPLDAGTVWEHAGKNEPKLFAWHNLQSIHNEQNA